MWITFMLSLLIKNLPIIERVRNLASKDISSSRNREVGFHLKEEGCLSWWLLEGWLKKNEGLCRRERRLSIANEPWIRFAKEWGGWEEDSTSGGIERRKMSKRLRAIMRSDSKFTWGSARALGEVNEGKDGMPSFFEGIGCRNSCV